jgi:serine/threonine protein kinase
MCDELIAIESLHDHVDSCRHAHESSQTVKELDDSMQREILRVQTMVLNMSWPGDESIAIHDILPVLHVVALLEKAASIDEQAPDALDQLVQLNHCLSVISVFQASQDVLAIFLSVRGLIVQKKCVLAVLSVALETATRTALTQSPKPLRQETSMADFQFVKKFADGGYSKVFLARKVRTGDPYAIKAIPKQKTHQMNELQRVLTEKDILSRAMEHMVKFFYSIIGKNNLYLVMEFVPGGDLCCFLNKNGSLPELAARTYAAEIVGALSFLRANNIVHRDLKPRNLVVSAKGRLKLIDFGLSTWGILDRGLSDDSPVEVVGTPDYMAPEIICQQRDSFAVDYWALGCIVYEMLVGLPPFHRVTPVDTFADILKGKYNAEDLAAFSGEVRDFIEKLLTTDPECRLGWNSIDEIRNHPWFAGIDWEHLEDLEPPYVPELETATDTGYFAEDFKLDPSCDADILADIEAAGEAHRPREPSFMGSDSFSVVASTDEGLGSFPTVGVQQLGGLTIEDAKRKISGMPKAREGSVSFPLFPRDDHTKKGYRNSDGMNADALIRESSSGPRCTTLSRSTSRGYPRIPSSDDSARQSRAYSDG